MLDVGSYAFDNVSGNNVQILERIDAWGYVSYRVYNPDTGEVYRVNESQLKIEENKELFNESYIRYVLQLSDIKNEIANGLVSSVSSEVIPLPHQTYVLNRVMENQNIRYILADEVGLGKTIEAGLVIKELKARGLVKRVLVVCPTGLVTQWNSEMKEKFNENFNIILPSDYDTIKRITGKDDVYSQYDQVISPMDSIKPVEKHAGWDEDKINKYNDERIYSIINSGWDLIIIDEAHRVAGSSNEVARYKLGNMLAQASPYLLLLTATPHNGKSEPFLRLVRLLDENAFPNMKSIVKEQVAPYLIRTEKRKAIDNNGNLLFKNRVTKLVELSWSEENSLQEELYTLVTKYVSTNYNKAIKNKKKNMCLIFLLIIMQRMVASSTAAIEQSLRRRLSVLLDQNTKLNSLKEEDLVDIDIENGSDEAFSAVSIDLESEIESLNEMISIAERVKYQHPDVKVMKLVDVIDSLLYEDRNQKVIIFTEFVATQQYLKEFLENKGYSVSALNGSMNIDERNEAIRSFRDHDNIFISTDAGGEGLNLQFANIIVNYDLPWNPMKIEQRCGRVDRIGQKKDVLIFNFIVENTIENRVREVLEEKLQVIFTELGVDKYSDVLDSEEMDVDFTDVYMRSLMNPKRIEENLYVLGKDIQAQVKNTKRFKEILEDNKDLSVLTGKESTYNIDINLKEMLEYYSRWKGVSYSEQSLSINSPEIKSHINKNIIFNKELPMLSVSIDDFPNEAGYFMLWELSISESADSKRIIPVFINEKGKLRPLSGKRIMDRMLDKNTVMHATNIKPIDTNLYESLERQCKDFAYQTFVELFDKYQKQKENTYNKYMYANKLQIEAAEKIGVKNIREGRIKRLEEEKEQIQVNYEKSKMLAPELKCNLLVRLEE